jgi:hypothetical protein
MMKPFSDPAREDKGVPSRTCPIPGWTRWKHLSRRGGCSLPAFHSLDRSGAEAGGCSGCPDVENPRDEVRRCNSVSILSPRARTETLTQDRRYPANEGRRVPSRRQGLALWIAGAAPMRRISSLARGMPGHLAHGHAWRRRGITRRDVKCSSPVSVYFPLAVWQERARVCCWGTTVRSRFAPRRGSRGVRSGFGSPRVLVLRSLNCAQT